MNQSAHSSNSSSQCSDEDDNMAHLVRMHQDPYYLEDADPCAGMFSNVKRIREHGYTSMWKLPPDETYSDWKVVAEMPSQEGKTERVYNVHRCMLTSGEVKSEYFAAQFRSEMQESNNRRTVLELTVEEANAFEYMLDFLYLDGRVPAADDPKRHSVETLPVPVLHHLGDYFGVPQLCEHALQLCRLLRSTMLLTVDEDAAMSKSLALAGLIRLTLQYDEAPMKRASAHLVAHAIGTVHMTYKDYSCVGSGLTDPSYLALILHLHRNIPGSPMSVRLNFVRVWLREHVDECDADMFRVLTSKDLVDKIPSSFPRAISDLVQSEQLIGAAQDDVEELSNVQQLVADFMKANWNTHTIEDRQKWIDSLSGYSSTVVLKMLGHTLTEGGNSSFVAPSTPFYFGHSDG